MGGPGRCDGKVIRCVDNFHEVKFIVDGVEFWSSECYFQCAKCLTQEEFEYVRTSDSVWIAGNDVKLRADWEQVKVRAMYTGVKAKFEQNEDIRNQLLATLGAITFVESTPFWNKWNGLINELVREELRPTADKNDDKITEYWRKIREYEQLQKLTTPLPDGFAPPSLTPLATGPTLNQYITTFDT